MSNLSKTVQDLFILIKRIKRLKGKIITCGNGGSATTASHFACDMVKALKIPTICLNDNVALITAIANDDDYSSVFSAQLEVLGNKKDILVVFSGSGNSDNILNALECAKKKQIESFAIVGFDGGNAKKLADHTIHFEIDDMELAEDSHLSTVHAIKKTLWTSKK